MKGLLISKSMRFFLFGSSLVIWLGIYLTGFDKVHWLLYVPAAFFIFAAVTGICPGIILSKLLFNEVSKNEPNT